MRYKREVINETVRILQTVEMLHRNSNEKRKWEKIHAILCKVNIMIIRPTMRSNG